MTKKYLFLLLTFSVYFISAQTVFGVKGGYNLSTFSAGNISYKEKSYFYIGALAEHYLQSKISIQGEIIYTELGGHETLSGVDFTHNGIVEFGPKKMDYKFPQIQIPVSVKYYLIQPFSVSAGINFGFNLSPEVQFTPEDLLSKNGKVENISTLNLFPFLGAEYQLKNRLFLDTRYHFNFFKINNAGIMDMKIGFFQIGLGYRFKS